MSTTNVQETEETTKEVLDRAFTYRGSYADKKFLTDVSNRFGGIGESAANRLILRSARKRYRSQDWHDQEVDLFPLT